MIAVNDIALAADANDMWAETTEQRRAYRKPFARMYFIRVLMSHIYEGLKIIEEINNSPVLRAAVEKCDAPTQGEFKELVAILNSTERRHNLYRFRNKATFHYDPKEIAKHLRAVIAHDPKATWAFSEGSTARDWHFELGDAVIDRMVIRYVFDADEDRNPARAMKVAAIATRLHQISTTFTAFASRFVERHLRQP
jgi:hypothetical protein